MKILMVEPGYAPYEKELNGLKEMQAAVGGPIQAIYPFDEQVVVVCNDEGLITGRHFNRSVPSGYGGVCGTFFVCGRGGEDFCSLTPAQMETYKKQFRSAEILLGAKGNEPVTIKVPPMDRGKSPKKKGRDTPHGRE